MEPATRLPSDHGDRAGPGSWLTAPAATAPGDLTVWLAGSTGSVVLLSVLIGLGPRTRTGTRSAWFALPWLVAPPVLLAAAEVAMPVYAQRYVAYCLPALAPPVGVGLAGISVAPRVIALLLIAGLGLPTQLAQRQVDGHGDDIRAAADIIAVREHSGDGVLYDCPTCHYPDMPREFAFAYPAAFGPLDDVALAGSPGASGTLRGTETDQATLVRRLDGINRVWLVETGGDNVPVALADSGRPASGRDLSGGRHHGRPLRTRNHPILPLVSMTDSIRCGYKMTRDGKDP